MINHSVSCNVVCFQGRRELKAVVYSYGGASCNITIDSATTAQQVKFNFQIHYCCVQVCIGVI